MTKMTKKEAFIALLAMAEVRENDEIVAILNREVELLEKRASAPRKPSKTQLENKALEPQILELLETDRVYSTAEICKLLGDGFSTQKISRILGSMKETGQIERLEERRKVFWKKIQ